MAASPQHSLHQIIQNICFLQRCAVFFFLQSSQEIENTEKELWVLQAASKILKVLNGGKIKLLSESSGDNLLALTMNESYSNSVKVIKPSRLVHCSTLTHVLVLLAWSSMTFSVNFLITVYFDLTKHCNSPVLLQKCCNYIETQEKGISEDEIKAWPVLGLRP